MSVNDEETRAEMTERVVSTHQSADNVEPGIVVQRVDKSPEGFVPFGFAEVGQSRRRTRLRDHLIGVERDECGRAADPRSHRVDASHPVRPLEQHFTHAAAT